MRCDAEPMSAQKSLQQFCQIQLREDRHLIQSQGVTVEDKSIEIQNTLLKTPCGLFVVDDQGHDARQRAVGSGLERLGACCF